jgi:NADPH:quinone reductase-like Zn-dependent oxidoreductase
MPTQRAIELQGEPGKAKLVTDRRLPRHRPGYVLVDVKAVALNPTDWKHIDGHNTKGALSGCDFAGVVAETGQGYTKDWKVGDRIAGFTHGGNQLELEDGAFAERIAAKADIAFRIPDDLSFEEASTLGVGIVTVGQGLFQQMQLSWPTNPSSSGDFVLIYGGSTATGTLGIQFAKL